MMNGFNIARIVVQILAILITLAGIGFVAAGVFTASWQTYEDGHAGMRNHEIHLHGLWFDWTFSESSLIHTANLKSGWTQKVKFGDAVIGDEAHRAQDYQVNTLILLCMSIVLALVSTFVSCCSCVAPKVSIGAVLSSFVATLLAIVGLASFYIRCLEPKVRYIMTDKRLEVFIGESFWTAMIGAGLFAIGTVFCIVQVVLVFMASRMTSVSDGSKKFPRHIEIREDKTNTRV